MAVTLQQWKDMFTYTAEQLLSKSDEFSRIDSATGDGDHGITIAKIANMMKEKSAVSFTCPKDFFNDLGWAAINVQGGSAGPLWGTFITGMGNASEDASVADVFNCGLKELEGISKAKVGDKTMMDAIIPGVEAMKAATGDSAALEAGAEAAKKGAADTVKYAAKYGRAKNYGERSIGMLDAGASSMAVFFDSMKAGYEKSVS